MVKSVSHDKKFLRRKINMVLPTITTKLVLFLCNFCSLVLGNICFQTSPGWKSNKQWDTSIHTFPQPDPQQQTSREDGSVFSVFPFFTPPGKSHFAKELPEYQRRPGVKRPAAQEVVFLPDRPQWEHGAPAANTLDPSGKEMKTFPPPTAWLNGQGDHPCASYPQERREALSVVANSKVLGLRPHGLNDVLIKRGSFFLEDKTRHFMGRLQGHRQRKKKSSGSLLCCFLCKTEKWKVFGKHLVSQTLVLLLDRGFWACVHEWS